MPNFMFENRGHGQGLSGGLRIKWLGLGRPPAHCNQKCIRTESGRVFALDCHSTLSKASHPTCLVHNNHADSADPSYKLLNSKTIWRIGTFSFGNFTTRLLLCTCLEDGVFPDADDAGGEQLGEEQLDHRLARVNECLN